MVDPSHYGTEKGQYDTGKNTEHFFSWLDYIRF
jgi:hypothetical protein